MNIRGEEVDGRDGGLNESTVDSRRDIELESRLDEILTLSELLGREDSVSEGGNLARISQDRNWRRPRCIREKKRERKGEREKRRKRERERDKERESRYILWKMDRRRCRCVMPVAGNGWTVAGALVYVRGEQ